MAQIFAGQIRFGVHAGPMNTTYQDYLHLWQAAEAMGYDWASVFDHFLPIAGSPEGPCFEGPTLLAAMAAQTSRIRCGILVIGNTYRNPAILANIAATIDQISGGRLEWGVGAGWYELEHHEYGVPFPAIGKRIRMLGEAAKIQKLLWSEHRASFMGRYYTLTDALCEPKPVQAQLPLWIGGAGEKLTLRVVAESADGWNTFLISPDAYRHKLAILAEHCRAVGRDPADIRKSLAMAVTVTDDAAEAARLLEQADGQGPAPLVGTAEQIAQRLMPYVELGVSDFITSGRAPVNYPALERFIEQVAPLVRKEAARLGATAAR